MHNLCGNRIDSSMGADTDPIHNDPNANDVDPARHLRNRALKQQVVAQLGSLALTGVALNHLFQQAADQVSASLQNEFCSVLELLPCKERLKMVSGVGWQRGVVGSAIVDAGHETLEGYTLQSTEPGFLTDLRQESRFPAAAFQQHGVVSGVSTIIGPHEKPWGVLGTHTSQCVDYTVEDVQFVVAVANILGSAVVRHRDEEAIRRLLQEIRVVYDNAPIGLAVFDRDLRFLRINDHLAEISGRAADEHIGQTVNAMLPDLAPCLEPQLRRAIEYGEQTIDRDIRITTHGEPRAGSDLLVSCIPLESAGRSNAASVVVREVTGQKHVERQLREWNCLLEEQVRRRTQLIEMLHDVASQVHHAESIEDAVQFALQRVAECNGWSFGHAFQISSDDDNQLVPLRAHYEEPNGPFRVFREQSADLKFRCGVGLPGRALA
mgnify:FL=1